MVDGVSYGLVELHVRQLKFRRNIAASVHIKMLDDLLAYMKTGEQIVEVLSLLPKYREGLNLVATGLLSSNPDIVKRTIDILEKIKTVRPGKEIFSNLNPLIQQVYCKRLAALNPDLKAPTY